ncbi:DUF2892 domain-containing protein [Candidatus Woesearchaeota archaeon]|nr:DUF2892 domain-containing protein [Candidatus Woesearchaeota archaeon]
MKKKNLMRLIIGLLVTLSAVLTYLFSPWWLILTLFVGLNLIQFSFTNWCLMEVILEKIGIKD